MGYAQKKKVRLNYQDYIQLPEDKRYELIDGDLYMVPAPIPFHQKVIMYLAFELQRFVEKQKIGEIFFAPVDVYLSDEDVVQPDLLFISKNRSGIIEEKYICGAPDLVVEVLSPASKARDKGIKKHLYDKFGVQEYWLVDPEAKSIEVLQMKEAGLKTFKVFAANSSLKSPLLKKLNLSLKKIFRS
ncbi:MAG: Uma2 family endonuclease [Deltaproteobacteria bacterium]|nr:Uma2 family endonuclease [Deltaproteobacteria bacterium]